MDQQRLPFYHTHIAAMEQLVRQSTLARHFAGQNLLLRSGQPLRDLALNQALLPPAEIAQLFMIPNDSVIQSKKRSRMGPDHNPPGHYLIYGNRFVKKPHQNSVGIYRTAAGMGLHADGLHIDHLFWDKTTVPKRLNTVGMALMAITAYKHGFTTLSLLAGGGAPPFRAQWGLPMIGYFVWPKYGFDAPVAPEEVADPNHPELQDCQTVQQVIAKNPGWWQNVGGNGRVMIFDLNPGSAAWMTLLHYIHHAHQAGEIP